MKKEKFIPTLEYRPTIKELERMAFRKKINEIVEQCREEARILNKRSKGGFKKKEDSKERNEKDISNRDTGPLSLEKRIEALETRIASLPITQLEERIKVLEAELTRMKEPDNQGVDLAYWREMARLTVNGDRTAIHAHNFRMSAMEKLRGQLNER